MFDHPTVYQIWIVDDLINGLSSICFSNVYIFITFFCNSFYEDLASDRMAVGFTTTCTISAYHH
jgi:hypothetical protein